MSKIAFLMAGQGSQCPGMGKELYEDVPEVKAFLDEAEMSRLVAAAGGQRLTCMGLAGTGDLIATCMSQHSRNRTFGEALARGSSLEEYERATHMVVEGARAAQSVSSIADERGIEAPITYAVRDALSGERGVNEIMEGLLRRLPHDEFYGFDE